MRTESQGMSRQGLGLRKRGMRGQRCSLAVGVQVHVARHDQAVQEALGETDGITALASLKERVRSCKPTVPLDLSERCATRWVRMHHAAQQ